MLQSIIQNPQGALLIIGCLLLVIVLAFGSSVCHKLSVLNHKYHIIGWEHDPSCLNEDDSDYE